MKQNKDENIQKKPLIIEKLHSYNKDINKQNNMIKIKISAHISVSMTASQDIN